MFRSLFGIVLVKFFRALLHFFFFGNWLPLCVFGTQYTIKATRIQLSVTEQSRCASVKIYLISFSKCLAVLHRDKKTRYPKYTTKKEIVPIKGQFGIQKQSILISFDITFFGQLTKFINPIFCCFPSHSVLCVYNFSLSMDYVSSYQFVDSICHSHVSFLFL